MAGQAAKHRLRRPHVTAKPEALQDLHHYEVGGNDLPVDPCGRLQRHGRRRLAILEEVDPHRAVDQDRPHSRSLSRSRRISSMLPSQLVSLPFRSRMLRCARRRTSSFSASSTTAFLVRSPVAAMALLISSSSIAMFVRVAPMMCTPRARGMYDLACDPSTPALATAPRRTYDTPVMISYVSTRGAAGTRSFEDVLLAGLAEDGGLFVPAAWPVLGPDDLRSVRGRSYAETTARVLEPFTAGCFTAAELRDLCADAYAG